MSTVITIRLTPERERLLKLFKSRHNIQKNAEAFELALRLGSDDELDYGPRINKVAGCLKQIKKQNADEIIRDLRGG